RRAWCDGPVGLAWATGRPSGEPPGAQLPFVRPSGDLAVTADARLDNRDELLEALGLDEGPRGAVPDAALILAAYERWGEGCPAHLLDDFAFALWDGRRRALFCARDHPGVKQLHYHLTESSVVFATELGALLALPWLPRRLNEARVADYLICMHQDH